MRKKAVDIEQELTTALTALKKARALYNSTYKTSCLAEVDYANAKKIYDDLFFDYVKYGNEDYWAKKDSARLVYEKTLKVANEARLNYKIACCKFKKAEKLYNKLRKKAEKMGIQWGEEQ